jgi:hypothetical protein
MALPLFLKAGTVGWGVHAPGMTYMRQNECIVRHKTSCPVTWGLSVHPLPGPVFAQAGHIRWKFRPYCWDPGHARPPT